MDEQDPESKPLTFSFETSDPMGVIVSMLVEIRSDINAMGVLLTRMYAEVYGVSLEDAAAEYARLRKDFVLDRAFELHDRHSKPPE